MNMFNYGNNLIEVNKSVLIHVANFSLNARHSRRHTLLNPLSAVIH